MQELAISALQQLYDVDLLPLHTDVYAFQWNVYIPILPYMLQLSTWQSDLFSNICLHRAYTLYAALYIQLLHLTAFNKYLDNLLMCLRSLI